MIIGLSGKIGSGKDECGLYLEKRFGFKIHKFATLIKDISALMTNTSYNDQVSQTGKQKYLDDWGMTIREFQQKLGTDAVRNGLHKDAWVLALLSKYNKESDRWAITDVRFGNEADKIKKLGGVIVRVERDANPYPQSDHPSETELDNYRFDHTIENSGSLNYLYGQVEKLMKENRY